MRPQTFEVKTQRCTVCDQRKPVGPADWLELAFGGYYPVCRECEESRRKRHNWDHTRSARDAAHYEKYMSASGGEI
jgi:hypothetical protein